MTATMFTGRERWAVSDDEVAIGMALLTVKERETQNFAPTNWDGMVVDNKAKRVIKYDENESKNNFG